MDPLRFGAGRRRRTPAGCCPAWSPASAATATASGLPNIGGEVVFDPSYQGNPLVNALCVGVLRHEDIQLATAAGRRQPGRPVRRARPAATASAGCRCWPARRSTTSGPTKRPSVQVGDPFMEKVLIECCLEVFAADLVVGIQDLGGAGLSCATSELASDGDGGMHVWLDRVPLRDASLSPEEILMSESQERMCAVVEPAQARRVPGDLRASGTSTATVIGEVNDTGRLTDRVARRARSSTCRRAPSRTRARSTSGRIARPAWPGRAAGRRAADDAAAAGDRRRAAGARCCSWSARPNLASQVVGHRPVRPLRAGQHRAGAAGGRRRGPGRRGRPASASRSPPTATAATPGSTRTPARSWRWPRPTATSRSPAPTPLAVTNCLNFGSPEDPDVMWQFAEAVRGLADACLRARHPGDRRQRQLLQPDRRRRDPSRRRWSACSACIDDVARRTPMGFGTRRRARSACSARRATSSAARSGRTSCTATSAGCRRGRPRGRAAAGRDARRRRPGGLLAAAHDVVRRRAGAGPVEMALRGVGAQVSLPGGPGPVRRPVLRVGGACRRRRTP